MNKLFPDKIMTLSAALHTLIGILTPVVAVLVKEGPINGRTIAIMIISGLLGGATGLLAFLSTTYARSKYTLSEKPEPAQTWIQ